MTDCCDFIELLLCSHVISVQKLMMHHRCTFSHMTRYERVLLSNQSIECFIYLLIVTNPSRRQIIRASAKD